MSKLPTSHERVRNPRVSFVVGGAQKCGTSAFHQMLGQHPELCMPKRKELHFFDNEAFFAQSREQTQVDAAYHALFPGNSGICFESTPIYLFWRAAAPRIMAYNKNIKWLLLLRDPVERAFSHWNMEFCRGAERLAFRQAAEQEIRNGLDCIEQDRVRSYVSRGLYAHQLVRLLEYFPLDQLLFIEYASFARDPSTELRRAFDFIGVPRISGATRVGWVNKIAYASRLDSMDIDWLIDFFKDDSEQLAALSGVDISSWMTSR